jgi:hypothetical protein
MRTAILPALSTLALLAVALVILLPRSASEVLPVRPETREEIRIDPVPASAPAAEPVEPPRDPYTKPPIPFELPPSATLPDEAAFADTPGADLLREAKKLWRTGDSAGARVRLAVLLGRSLAHEMRVEALMELGFACRHLGAREQEEQALRDAVALAEQNSWQGVFAHHHLAWTLHFKGADREALQISDQVLSSPHSNDWLRGRARWLRGRAFEALEERELARTEYTLLLEEFGAVESLADVREDVRRRMKLLGRD